MKDFETKLDGAVKYLESHSSVVFAYLFGSLATGGLQTPMSDIDIAVYLNQNAVEFECRLKIIGRLSDVFRTDDLDVVVLNYANPALIMNILKDKKILVDKEPFVRHRFESMAFRQYFDFAPLETALLEKKVLKSEKR